MFIAIKKIGNGKIFMPFETNVVTNEIFVLHIATLT